MSGGRGAAGVARQGGAGTGRPVDLDAAPPAPPAPDPAPPAARRGARWLALWLVLAALVGAGAGTAVTARHAAAVERARAQADAGERAVLALQAGAPYLARGAGTPDARGRAAVTISVPLYNRGTETLRVDVVGLDAAGQSSSERPSPLVVPPGTTVAASVPIVARCADVLPPVVGGGSRRAGDGALRVRVDLDGGSRETALPLVEPYGETLADVLSFACGPPQRRRAPVSATWTPREDGSLEVTVVAPLLGSDLTLDLRQGLGLGVRSDPPLPLTFSSQQGVTLSLTMNPTCSVVAPPGQVPSASLDVVTMAGREVQAGVPDDDGVKAVWAARQLALRCG